MSKIADAGGISKSLLFHYFLNKNELYLYLWENAEKLFYEINRQYYSETSDFFEAIRQRFLARFAFMRESPVVFLFGLQAFFEENPEVKETIRNNIRILCDKETDEIMAFVETSVFRPGIDVRLLVQEIEGFYFIKLWQIFSHGEYDVNCLEEDFVKRIEQWKAVYLKENYKSI